MRELGSAQAALDQEPSPPRRRLLLLILVLTLVRGIVYLAIFPPWQHYDEPTHFEYVRLIAERGRLPQPDEYDLAMRQEIASSMQAAGFWKGLRTPTIDFWSEDPPAIGVSELQHPPLYYALLALPQRFVAHQSVETQLYVARFSSLLLNLLVVVSAYGLTAEALPQRRWLPLAVAAFIALLPPFTDLMSAVNNDAGAAAASTLLMWAALRLIRRGPSLKRVGSVLLLAAICVVTKTTAGGVAVVVLLTVAAGYVRRRHRWWLCGAVALSIPALLVAGFRWGGHAAHWYNTEPAAADSRVAIQTPLGQFAFVLSAEGDEHPRTIFQELSRKEGQRLREHSVTLGAWVRAPEGGGGFVTLGLDEGSNSQHQQLVATSDWQFHAFHSTIGKNAPDVAVSVAIPKRKGAAKQVFVDGVVLVDEAAPLDLVPQFQTGEATKGRWGENAITNLLRNGSAERAWPSPRPWLGNLSLYRYPLTHVFHSVWEWSRTAWVYGLELSILHKSFWGGFGWNHLILPDGYFFLLGALGLAGVVGVGVHLVRQSREGQGRKPWQWRAWGLLGITLLASWGGAILRIHPVFITEHLYWPVARYGTVAIAPTALILCLGLTEILPHRVERAAAWLGVLGLLALEAIAMWSVILPYYYG